MEKKNSEKTVFGFWVYLMTDLLMFAVLFATYAVLRDNTFGGPSIGALVNLNSAFAETLILLTSSFTCGLALLAADRGKKNQTIAWLATTLVLGFAFLSLELAEFSGLIASGNSWTANASLSSFFALVGTHGLHIALGSLWIIVMMAMIWSRGLTPFVMSRLNRLVLFWHFLDLVWIFIFTMVYLMGMVR